MVVVLVYDHSGLSRKLWFFVLPLRFQPWFDLRWRESGDISASPFQAPLKDPRPVIFIGSMINLYQRKCAFVGDLDHMMQVGSRLRIDMEKW